MQTDRTTLVGPGARYHRVSTSGQDTERQEADIDRWLATVGAVCSHTYTDHDSRDKAEERYDFQKLMRAVQSKAVNWVVVQTIDRLGFKDTYEFFHFIDVFRANGVQLWSAIDGACISHADDARILTNAIAGLTSTKEQVEKANRIQTKRLEAAKLGRYQGGFAPYGMDVLCHGPDGREKFRYVLIKAARRIGGRTPTGKVQYHTTIEGRKITATNPEGEPCTSVPAHDKKDVLTLAPTVLLDRIEVVQRIYKLLDIEATNPTQVAKLLNKEGVCCPTGDLWTDAKLRHLIKNPIYMGLPTSNKGGQPRFFEIRGGSLHRVEGRGKQKHIRRDRSEWLMPDEPLFDAIIPPETWERVNKKIEPGNNRAPRSEELYLSGLLYCGRCEQRMFGFKVGHPYYQCSTRNKFGADNPTGCRFNCTRTDAIEPLILEFLAKRGQSLDELIGTRRDAGALERLLNERSEHSAELRAILERMKGYVHRHLDSGIQDLDGIIPGTLSVARADVLPDHEHLDSMSIVDLYDLVSDQKSSIIKAELAELEAQHADLGDKIARLKSPMMIERLDAQASEIESRIIALRAELEPLSQRWDQLQAELLHLRRRLAEAEQVMVKGSNRMKAEALRACIQRINCWYEYSPGGKTILKRVEIVPQIGEAVEFFPSDDPHRHATG